MAMKLGRMILGPSVNLYCTRSRARHEKPVPTSWESVHGLAAGQAFIPGVEDFAEGRGCESGLVEAEFELGRLPELLPQALEVELAKRKIIVPALAVEAREPLGFLRYESLVNGL